MRNRLVLFSAAGLGLVLGVLAVAGCCGPRTAGKKDACCAPPASQQGTQEHGGKDTGAGK